jgi:hypothetical protein
MLELVANIKVKYEQYDFNQTERETFIISDV